MPNKLLKSCNHQGCSQITQGTHCNAHRAERSSIAYGRSRQPTTQQGYDNRWRKVRAQFLSAHPLCMHCQNEGKINPATEVHHIVRIVDGGENNFSNLQALCKPCHSRETRRHSKAIRVKPCGVGNINPCGV